MCLVLCLWLYLLVGNLWFPYSRSSCADNSLDHSLQIISSVSEVWGVCIHSLYKFHVFSVQCMIIHINICDIERSSGFLVSIFKLPAERTTASLSISIRQSVAPILRFHLAPRELPSLSRHEGGSSHRESGGWTGTFLFLETHFFLQTWETRWDKGTSNSTQDGSTLFIWFLA